MPDNFSVWLHDKTSKTYEGHRPFEVKQKIEPGYYDLNIQRFTGAPIATAIQQKEDRVCHFSSGPLVGILKEIETFWGGDEAYKELGITHKRSVLLYGPPGCGKTGIITSVIANIVNRNGIAVRISNVRDFAKAIQLFRQIEPDTPIVAITEDIEEQISYDETYFLEVLDGSSSIGGNVLYLSTTNKLEEIPERIRCRPSRMDTLIEVSYPSINQRTEYIEFMVGHIKGATKFYKTQLAEQSNEFSLADLKELIVSTYVYKKTVADAVKIISAAKGIVDPKKEDEDDDEDDDGN